MSAPGETLSRKDAVVGPGRRVPAHGAARVGRVELPLAPGRALIRRRDERRARYRPCGTAADPGCGSPHADGVAPDQPGAELGSLADAFVLTVSRKIPDAGAGVHRLALLVATRGSAASRRSGVRRTARGDPGDPGRRNAFRGQH